MTDLSTTITAAIGHLDWCTQIPHTLDQIVGIYAEATAEQPTFRFGLTPGQMAAIIKAAAGGGGGHSDPTAGACSLPSARDDADLGSIDASIDLIAEAALDIDHRTSDALGLERWCPPASARSRDDRVRDAVSRLHHAHVNVPAAAAIDHDIVELVRLHLADTAEWLHGKALGIWKASRGETKTAAVQRAIVGCSSCARFGLNASVAAGRYAEWCRRCGDFRTVEGILPSERICQTWDRGGRCTPTMTLEAKAQAKPRTRKRGA